MIEFFRRKIIDALLVVEEKLVAEESISQS